MSFITTYSRTGRKAVPAPNWKSSPATYLTDLQLLISLKKYRLIVCYTRYPSMSSSFNLFFVRNSLLTAERGCAYAAKVAY